MPPKFFITHSWKDIDFARRLCDDLRRNGLDGFFDERSLHPGDSIPSRIERGLEECDVYIPVFSPDAIKSRWSDWEIDIAIVLNREGGRPHIIPVIAKKCTIPARLRQLLYVNFEGRYDNALNELLTRGFGLPPKPPPTPVNPSLVEPKVPAVAVAPPQPVSKSPNIPVIPKPAPKSPAATRPWKKRVIPIIGTLVAGVILVAFGIGVYLTGFFAPPTPTLHVSVPTIAKTAADGATMMFVPAGEFLMGSGNEDKQAWDNEKPQHSVYLDAFWIDKNEVSNALYKKCMDAGQCSEPAYWVNGAIPSGEENYPVVDVSWNDAVAYARWTGRRLPTEAEWEKAACWDEAKQVKRIYPWGNTFDKNLLNSIDGGRLGTAPVGSFPGGVSPYGLLDMAGNVYEWTADWYDGSYYSNSPKDNPKGPASGQNRVMRGGSWSSNQGNVRCTTRFSLNADLRNFDIGFRVAESVSP